MSIWIVSIVGAGGTKNICAPPEGAKNLERKVFTLFLRIILIQKKQNYAFTGVGMLASYTIQLKSGNGD